MTEKTIHQCLNFTCELARQLLCNGAEIYRVEESARRILTAYGFERQEVFAIPSCIIITIEHQETNFTKSVRMTSSSNNLDKLERLNSLCRSVCSNPVPLTEAMQSLNQIIHAPSYSQLVSYLGYGCVAFFFTLLWGGNYFDAFVSFFCGIVIKLITAVLAKRRTSVFFTNIVASMVLVLIPVILSILSLPLHADMVIIGAIMLLVPGIAITNVMRDVIAGDFVTAISKLTEVLIVAMAIAIGIAIPYGLVQIIFGVV